MFAYLKGTIIDISEDNLILEVGDIGYNIKISATTAGNLPSVGSKVQIYTYTCVREDSFSLYGFLTRDDLEFFKLLITVNGIGPKGGLGILSALTAEQLRLAILSQDAKTIAKAPGIGAKSAQRILLDLKDKVSLEDSLYTKEANAYVENRASVLSSAATEAVEALTALGYSGADALRAVNQVEEKDSMDVETLLKAALKKMF